LSGTGRVAGGDGANSILPFRLERVGDRMKHCRKIKRTTLGEGEVSLEREKGGDDAWDDANLTRSKNKENPHGRFNCYK
jgi:hypothetical protein